MLRKLALLAAITGFAAAATLVPLETQAGDQTWKREVHGYQDGRHAPHFTVITQPTHQVYVRPYYPYQGHYHPGFVYAAPAQPMWVPAGWYWTGYQWVWVSGYWR